jgi:general stress protein YciG
MSKPRGFAAWDKEKLRETARKGGTVAQATGRGHTYSREEARIAGAKGGRARRRRSDREAAIENGAVDTEGS